MSLFASGNHRLSSGKKSHFLFDCDYLSDRDIKCLAEIIAGKIQFCHVIPVPSGGIRLSKYLMFHAEKGNGKLPVLIVDDVLTTGRQITQLRNHHSKKYGADGIIGVVLFARGKCPDWVTPVFTLNEKFW